MTNAMQVWRQMGLVVEPQPMGSWWHSHASYPTACPRDDGLVDIYFSVRDAKNRSSLACLTLELAANGFSVVDKPTGPMLSPGARGAFDADGVSVTSLVEKDGILIAYYLGWTVGTSVPFTNFVGIATKEKGSRSAFQRHGIAPVLGRSSIDPFSMGYPWVVRAGDGFRMWYGSHLFWGDEGLAMEHVIKDATSSDGLTWTATGHVAVPLDRASDPEEFAVSRPCVIVENDGSLSMWFARRCPGYELAFARSTDGGQTWTRWDNVLTWKDEPMAWDNIEQTYPCVFDHAGHRYMLYNGNGYGRSGFGIAILEP